MVAQSTEFWVRINMNEHNIATWGADWAWSLPLIVITVVIHVFGLSLIKRPIDRVLPHIHRQRTLSASGRWCIGGAALCITLLHSLEALLWAATFLLLGALPNARAAILYSLNAMTSFGHVNLYLQDRWQLMGALEALNGWILFGLSTAFLFALIRAIWSHSQDASPTGRAEARLHATNHPDANAAD